MIDPIILKKLEDQERLIKRLRKKIEKLERGVLSRRKQQRLERAYEILSGESEG